MVNDITKQMFLDAVNRLMTAIRGHSHPEKANTHSPALTGLPTSPDLVLENGEAKNDQQIVNYKTMVEEMSTLTRFGKRQSIVFCKTDEDGNSDFLKNVVTASQSELYVKYRHYLKFNTKTIAGSKANFVDEMLPLTPWVCDNQANVSLVSGGIASSPKASINAVSGGREIYLKGTAADNYTLASGEEGWSESFYFTLNSAPTGASGSSTSCRMLFQSARKYFNGYGYVWDQGLAIVVQRITSSVNRIQVWIDPDGASNVLLLQDNYTSVVSGTEYYVEVIYDAVQGRYLLCVDGVIRDMKYYTPTLSVDATASPSQTDVKYEAADESYWNSSHEKSLVKGAPITFLSGANAGLTTTVYDIQTSTNTITLGELPYNISPGDTYVVGQRNIFGINKDNIIDIRRLGRSSNFSSGSDFYGAGGGMPKFEEYRFRKITNIAGYLENNGASHTALLANTSDSAATVLAGIANSKAPAKMIAETVFNSFSSELKFLPAGLTLNQDGVDHTYGLYVSASNGVNETKFDVFSPEEIDTYINTGSVDKEIQYSEFYPANGGSRDTSSLRYRNKNYIYAVLLNDNVLLYSTVIPPQHSPNYNPNALSLLAFPDADNMVDFFGSEWTNSDAVTLNSGYGLLAFTTTFPTTSNSGPYIKSNIQNLPERWTMKFRIKKETNPTFGQFELISFTNAAGATADCGIRLMITNTQLILQGNTNYDAGGWSTIATISSGLNTTNDYDVEIVYDGSYYHLKAGSGTSTYTTVSVPDTFNVVQPNNQTTLTIGTRRFASANSVNIRVYGFTLQPFVAWGTHANTGTEFVDELRAMFSIGSIELPDTTTIPDGMPNTFYFDTIRYQMNYGIKVAGAMSDDVAFGGIFPVVFLGDITFDSEKIVDSNAYAIDGKYTSKWNLITAVGSAPVAVVAATVQPGTLSTDFANGQTVDGVTLVTGNVILIKDQINSVENGVYTVQSSGAPSRLANADSWTELKGYVVSVSGGSTNIGTKWTTTIQDSGTVGTTDIIWGPYSNEVAIKHAVGSNEINIATYENTIPSDRLKWKSEGPEGTTGGVLVKDITSSKLKLKAGSGSVASAAVGTLRYAYVKTVVERNW